MIAWQKIYFSCFSLALCTWSLQAEHLSVFSKKAFARGNQPLLLLCYQQRRKEMRKLEEWRAFSFSFLLFFSCWCSFLSSSIFILLLRFYLLFVVLLMSNHVFCLFTLLSSPFLHSRGNLLSWVEERDRLGEEHGVKTEALVMSWSFSWAGWLYLQHTSSNRPLAPTAAAIV